MVDSADMDGGCRMNRRAALLLSIAAVAFALVSAGCGSDDGDGDTPTPGVEASLDGGGATTPQPENPGHTPLPGETPEPTETSTPAATPTAATLTFDRSDSGNGSKTAGSYGPLGIVYADSAHAVQIGQNRMQASAYVNVGINERPSASAWQTNLFRVPGEGNTPVNVQISTGVNWQGVLAGNGAGGTRAAVTITLGVLDVDDRVVASEVVHALEHREAALTLGGFDDIGRADVDMQVALLPGRYELRLTLTCEASSGFIGAVTHCVYGVSDVYTAGFVAWEPRTILFVP